LGYGSLPEKLLVAVKVVAVVKVIDWLQFGAKPKRTVVPAENADNVIFVCDRHIDKVFLDTVKKRKC
jgi:hypothetical protein